LKERWPISETMRSGNVKRLENLTGRKAVLEDKQDG